MAPAPDLTADVLPPNVSHTVMANAIRALSMDAVEAAKSGHPGMPMGMADVATVLFSRFLRFDPSDPAWPDRDRFVLSAGHGSMLLYSLLFLTGHGRIGLSDLRQFRQLGAATPGHPELDRTVGIETTTGPLGQGFANAVGMALAERLLNARFGDALVDHHTYTIVSDGDLMEGISHEAASLAGHLRLSKLIALHDDNHISIDGPTDLTVSDDTAERFLAYGWHVTRVDGHDPDAVERALAKAIDTDRPSLICCRTTIGFGAPTKANSEAAHGAPLGAEEVAGAKRALDWPYGAFEIPEPVLAAWRSVGRRHVTDRLAWYARVAGADPAVRRRFEACLAGDLPEGFDAAVAEHREQVAAEAPRIATRAASGRAIDRLMAVMPELVGGSADLTQSNVTKPKTFDDVGPGRYAGRHVRWGVREHAMGAAMNGMALHGGIVPYGGTFLAFADYCRPAIRMSAMMRQRVVYVMTHDSIGVGEDGPTHQPVEHLTSLRAIPNLLVMRPCDAVETAECWEIALRHRTGPSVLALTRQPVEPVRRDNGSENLSRRGAYVLRETARTPQVVIMGTGSEMALAVAAFDMLDAEGIAARVVSVPSMELFRQQDAAYRMSVLGERLPRVAVEAGLRMGWNEWLGRDGGFVGMTGFGVSAPYQDVYRHFGITAEAVAAAARERVLR